MIRIFDKNLSNPYIRVQFISTQFYLNDLYQHFYLVLFIGFSVCNINEVFIVIVNALLHCVTLSMVQNKINYYCKRRTIVYKLSYERNTMYLLQTHYH